MDPDRPFRVPEDLVKPSEFTAEHRRAAKEKLFAKGCGEKAAAADNKSLGSNGVEEEEEEEEEGEVIENLIFGAKVIDQNDLERGIATRAEKAIVEKENEFDQKRLEKALGEKEKLEYQLGRIKMKANNPKTSRKERVELKEKIRDLEEIVATLDSDIADITARIEGRSENVIQGSNPSLLSATSQRLPYETEREFLIRTGKITPFAKLLGFEKSKSNLDDGMAGDIAGPSMAFSKPMSHQNLRKPGFRTTEKGDEGKTSTQRRRRATESATDASESDFSPKSKKSKMEDEGDGDYEPKKQKIRKRRVGTSDDEELTPKKAKGKRKRGKLVKEGDESASSIEDEEPEDYMVGEPKKRRKTKGKLESASLDDGNEKAYQARLKEWATERRKMRLEFQASQRDGENEEVDGDEHEKEWYMPHPTEPDAEFTGGFKIPGDIFPSLFDYQKSGVQWLWELHCLNAGGILSDEMGLGKTIQIISLIAGLHYSKMLERPVLVVAPATVLKQWVKEFHCWWPPMRVAILHNSGSGMMGGGNDNEDFETKGKKGAKVVVERVFREGHILVATYAGLKTYADILLGKEWDYAILDEGHQIRNPDAEVTLNCKRLKTRHRVILSGTPVQNNLTELWSLFDFVYPGRLGVLPVFNSNFAHPIKLGGYKGANNFAVNTAQKCTLVLRELIGPYLLRRQKADVAADLPRKTEQVLFCKLTKYQRDKYAAFLKSDDYRAIVNKSKNMLFGLDIVRKICNHPDLLEQDVLINKPGYNYGEGKYSGKMKITKSLLQLWKKEGHRTLLFCQTRQMLDILEKYVAGFPEGFQYRRMDGETPIHQRQALIEEFNRDENLDVFLLTTRVGGLGVNLIGADRVIIFDPDWNPSTDMQARERAWRLGQKRPVTIFRLLTAGTIEEKVYQRQIFKQHLASKVLTDPNQSRFFEAGELHDLFSLGTSSFTGGTETGSLFRGSEKVLNGDTSAAKSSDDKEDSAIGSIEGVARVEKQVVQDPEVANSVKDMSEEQRLLEGILGNAGVLSALEHDTVLNASGSRVETMTEREAKKFANKIAEKAAKALRDSIAATQATEVGTVTWTGRHGTAGREQADESYTPDTASAPSAAGILGGLRKRNNTPSSSRGNSQASSVTPSRPTPLAKGIEDLSPESLKMIVGLRRYLISHGGEATPKELSGIGKEMAGGKKERQEEFVEMLKEIAVLGDDKMWRLRRDYGGSA